MTQKELLYVEDAIAHEKSIISICEDMVTNLEDSDLINFINDEITIHNETKNELLNLLEDCQNE